MWLLVPSSTSQALKDALERGREGGREHADHLTGLNGLYGSGSDSYFVCSLKGMLKARGFISHLKNGGNQPALDATTNAGSNGFIWCLYELLPSTQPYLKIAVVPGLLRVYVLLLHRTIHPFILPPYATVGSCGGWRLPQEEPRGRVTPRRAK